MAQQTAVDWLIEKIIISSEHTDNINSDRLFFYRLYQQAKQMEKEQQKTLFDCGRNFQITGEGTFKQVYQELYGKQ